MDLAPNKEKCDSIVASPNLASQVGQELCDQRSGCRPQEDNRNALLPYALFLRKGTLWVVAAMIWSRMEFCAAPQPYQAPAMPEACLRGLGAPSISNMSMPLAN